MICFGFEKWFVDTLVRSVNFGVEVPDDGQHDLKQNIPNTLRHTNIRHRKMPNKFLLKYHQHGGFSMAILDPCGTPPSTSTVPTTPNTFNNGRPSRIA